MGQAIPQTKARFPLASIIKRVNGLAHFPTVKMGKEPFLEEVMSDPIIRQLMAADNLEEKDVRGFISRAQTHFSYH